MISFRIHWFDHLVVEGTPKSLLQDHSSKVSVLLYGPTVTSIHDYKASGREGIPAELLQLEIALTRWTFVGKVMSLLFNMLSRFMIAFLPRSKRLLISGLQSPSAVILEPKKIVSHCFHCFPIYMS